MYKRLTTAILIICVFIGYSPLLLDSTPTTPPITSERTKEQIFERFITTGAVDNHLSTAVSVFLEEPALQYPHAAGQLTTEFIRQGVAEANFVRYLAGLPYDLVSDHTLNNRAQHGAALLAAEVQLSLFPPKPENIAEQFYELAVQGTSSGNLSWGANTLYQAVRASMFNSDNQGIAELGHRRWLLNPTLMRIGFGYAERFSVIQVLDRSRRESVGNEITSWPAAGYFPVEYMAGNQAWSVSLNPSVYDNNRIDGISVLLTRRADGMVWSFSNEDDNPGGKFFNVSTHGYGVPFCIIFKPDDIERFEPDDEFAVEVLGVYRLNGEPAFITYEVSFFQLFAKIILTIGSETATAVSGNVLEVFDLSAGGGVTPIFDTVSGRTLVPLRTIVEYMGGRVNFIEESQTVVVNYRDRTVQMGINRRSVMVNGHIFNTDAVPQIMNGLTMVPVRFLSESLGARVHWCGETQGVTIVYLP
jgi:hypothetical protein